MLLTLPNPDKPEIRKHKYGFFYKNHKTYTLLSDNAQLEVICYRLFVNRKKTSPYFISLLWVRYHFES